MDLNTIKTTDRKVNLTHPATGEELGLVFAIQAPDSDEVKNIDRAWQNKRLQPKNRNKSIVVEELEVVGDKRIMAAVTGWSWEDKNLKLNGKQPEFSRQALKTMLKDYPWIREFLVEECGDQAAFY